MRRREFLVTAAGAGAWMGMAHTTLPRADIPIVTFSDAGKRIGLVHVPKVRKSDAEWRKQLTPAAFHITREGGTEQPFTGAYWNLHEQGFFRCICCDTALFSTGTKFDSGTGWPSFYDVMADENIAEGNTRRPGEVDSDLACALCDAHLGDVFSDGPPPTGLRYCIDSPALRFVKFVKKP